MSPVSHRAVRTLVAVAAGLLATAAAGETADRAPVLIRSSLFLTPIEAAGTGLAPEVKVRVTVDARGRVAAAEVLDVQPASDHDETFRQATAETLAHWRYAPAIVGGQAAEATLEWTVKFQAREEGDQQRGPAGIRLGLARTVDAEARRAQVLALPLEQRKQLLQQQAKIAEGFLDSEHRQRFDSPRFVVVSDAKEPRVAEVTAGNLEAIFNIVGGLFQPRIEPQPEPYKIVVYLFAAKSSFEAFKSELEVYEWSVGFYSPTGLFAFHLEMRSMESLVGTMMHEACHAYVDRHLVEPGSYLPRWLGEGFAEYVGNSEIRKGELIPGRVANDRFVLVLGYGAVRARSESRLSLDEVKRKIRGGEGLTVEQLTTAGSETFYGDKRALFYPTSWLLVHFLRHGEPDWAEREFPRLMLYVAEGYPASQVLETVYGVAPAALEKRFRDYVLKQF